MVKYSCETCQKVFTQKGHYDSHTNRKRPCKKDNTIEALVEQKVQEVLSKTNIGLVKIDSTPTTTIQLNQMDYSKKTREELIAICKEKSIKGYSEKKKEDIVKLLTYSPVKNEIVVAPPVELVADKLKMIDLFAGTWAFTLAFQGTNAVNVVFGNDMVEHSKQVYDENFNHKLTLKNLNEVKVEEIPSHAVVVT